MTPEQISSIEKHLSDPLWRLEHLYQIVDKEGKERLFKLNWAQKQLYENLWFSNVILKARQLGISTLVCLYFLDICLFKANVAAGIIAHTREDAEHMFKRIKFAYDKLPDAIKQLRTATVDSARELVFNNHSSLRVGTSMRGSTLQYLHVSEFGKICAHWPDKAREIITGSLNALGSRQYIFIESTAEGKEGAFYDMCKEAESFKISRKNLSALDYRFHFFPWHACSDYELKDSITIPSEVETYFDGLRAKNIVLSEEKKNWYYKKLLIQKEDMKREYPSTPDEAFESVINGSYYWEYLVKAKVEGRISSIPYDAETVVHTAWDLGYGDSTAIWFFQICGKEIHLIDYYEDNQKALVEYIRVLKDKKYSYGSHLAPHDIGVHEFSSGKSRQELAARHGINFIKVSDVGVDEGIDAARIIFQRLWFDEKNCSLGLKALNAYRRQWNEKQGCWGAKPLHNFASHAADAFRILAVGLDCIIGGSDMSDSEAEKLYNKYHPRFD